MERVTPDRSIAHTTRIKNNLPLPFLTSVAARERSNRTTFFFLTDNEIRSGYQSERSNQAEIPTATQKRSICNWNKEIATMTHAPPLLRACCSSSLRGRRHMLLFPQLISLAISASNSIDYQILRSACRQNLCIMINAGL
jgi:hypothetical protein